MSDIPAQEQWWYESDGQAMGPVNRAAVELAAAEGRLTAETRVWREGWADWVPAGKTELADLVSGPQPVVPEEAAPPPNQTEPEAAPISEQVEPESSEPPASEPTEPIYTEEMLAAYLGQAQRLAKSLRGRLTFFSIAYGLAVIGFSWVGSQGASTGGQVSGTMGLAIMLGLAGFIVCLTINYTHWRLIQDGRSRTTPGRAVGLQFIPLFNFYWNFVAYWGLAKDMNTYLTQTDSPRRAVEALPLAYSIVACLSVVGFLIPSLITQQWMMSALSLGSAALLILAMRTLNEAALAIIEHKVGLARAEAARQADAA